MQESSGVKGENASCDAVSVITEEILGALAA